MSKPAKREFVQVLRLLEVFQLEDVRAGVREAIARGVISIDAVKHLVLCRIERGPPPLNLEAERIADESAFHDGVANVRGVRMNVALFARKYMGCPASSVEAYAAAGMCATAAGNRTCIVHRASVMAEANRVPINTILRLLFIQLGHSYDRRLRACHTGECG
jgi:hypothetical protein